METKILEEIRIHKNLVITVDKHLKCDVKTKRKGRKALIHSLGHTDTRGVRWQTYLCKGHWNAASCSSIHIFKSMLKNWTGTEKSHRSYLKGGESFSQYESKNLNCFEY